MPSTKKKTVSASELTLLKMVAGGEKKHRIVVDTDGILKEWVGFGWINLREATQADRDRWPIVVPKRETNATARSRPKAKPRRK